jgi:myo-inositol 2-dehydrogenase/D-chiro-inositol 1-dehydrogenase
MIELQDWIDSIAKGRPSTLATAHDGLRASLVADALVKSMRTNGSWVKVPD